jgi:polysaccharide export outer membrane protein
MKLSSSLLILGVSLFLMVGSSGCFSSNPADINSFLRPDDVSVTAKQYILQPPDEIEVHCTRVPEIHLQRQQIRPDGNVTFEGLGDIFVAGKTPAQVADILKAKVSELYTLSGNQPIDVRIAAFQSKFYYVLGQAYDPGKKLYTGRDSVLSVVAEARPNPMAWNTRIQVIRPSSDPNVKAKIFEFNLEDVQNKGDTSRNVMLEEGDVVFIPPTPLAWVGLLVEELVRPIGRAFSTVSIVNRSQMVGGGGGGGY